MTCDEFSDMMTTLLNSYATQAEFGEGASKQEIALDEYEKSVLLTQAQDIVVKSYFDKKKSPTGDGMDDSSERQVDFSSLITSVTLTKSQDQSSVFDDRGILYDMPERSNGATDVLFILNEKLVSTADGVTKNYVVVPLNYKEYDREMSRPYSQPQKKQAWRLFQNPNTGFDFKSELIPRWDLTTTETISGYKIRYIRRPTPIVLTALPDGLTIDGVTTKTECELNPILHPDILQKAVELAAISKGLVRSDNQNRQ